jgi:hypothetical protein
MCKESSYKIPPGKALELFQEARRRSDKEFGEKDLVMTEEEEREWKEFLEEARNGPPLVITD